MVQFLTTFWLPMIEIKSERCRYFANNLLEKLVKVRSRIRFVNCIFVDMSQNGKVDEVEKNQYSRITDQSTETQNKGPMA